MSEEIYIREDLVFYPISEMVKDYLFQEKLLLPTIDIENALSYSFDSSQSGLKCFIVIKFDYSMVNRKEIIYERRFSLLTNVYNKNRLIFNDKRVFNKNDEVEMMFLSIVSELSYFFDRFG